MANPVDYPEVFQNALTKATAMRVLTEEALHSRRQTLQDAIADLRRQIRVHRRQLRLLDELASELVEIGSPAVSSDKGVKQVDLTTEAENLPHGAMNRVQVPLLALVGANPGLARPEVVRLVSDRVGTSRASVRETIRRLISLGRLRLDEDNRLYNTNEEETNG